MLQAFFLQFPSTFGLTPLLENNNNKQIIQENDKLKDLNFTKQKQIKNTHLRSRGSVLYAIHSV